MWYAATYPRSLDYYFRPKLVVTSAFAQEFIRA